MMKLWRILVDPGVCSLAVSTACKRIGRASLLGIVLAGSVAATSGHVDPVTPVALAIAVILIAAKAGGEIAIRLGQPAVLGELLAGVALGNLSLVGFGGLDWIKQDGAIEMLAGIGVLVLLFEVGLESTVGEMMRVGFAAFLVALVGVIAPMALGWGVGAWLLPDSSGYVHAFLGAILCATSVGITARVLQDLGKSKTIEARLILGAAVIDDVLGLVVLAVMGGVIAAANAGGTVSGGEIGIIVGKASVFLIGSLALGVAFSGRLFTAAAKLRTKGVLLASGLSFCFLLSWLSGTIGLAPIVGAFAAGLILEDIHYREFVGRGENGLEELVKPIASFLVPIFFVLMGMRTDLRSFMEPGVLSLAGALTVAAILGKQACSLAAITPGVNKLAIGFGMIPRGEVGLIFANIGATLKLDGQPVVTPSVYSAVVVMVVATTMATPPLLAWRLKKL